jgi:hypothetical protein
MLYFYLFCSICYALLCDEQASWDVNEFPDEFVLVEKCTYVEKKFWIDVFFFCLPNCIRSCTVGQGLDKAGEPQPPLASSLT